MQSPRHAIDGAARPAGAGDPAAAGRPSSQPGRGPSGPWEVETRPLEIMLVTLREGVAHRVATSLRNDPRCRLSRGDPVRTLHGAGPADVDAVILDHLLYSDIYLNELNKAARRAVVLAMLERSELLSAGDFLMRADGFLFADGQAGHAFDVIACAMVGYCAMPGDLGQGNPFSRQRLERARALGALDMQILRMLGRGWSNREIAHGSGISEARVKAALRALLHKLSLANRTEAAVFYVYNRATLDADVALHAGSAAADNGGADAR